MSESRFFSWKKRTWQRVLIEDRLGYAEVILIPRRRFEIKCYESRIKNDLDGTSVPLKLLHYREEENVKGRVQLKRGLFQDYLEILSIEDKNIEPTLTVNLCFNNRFYFGWLPLFLAILVGCVSPFIWKKVRRGVKIGIPKNVNIKLKR